MQWMFVGFGVIIVTILSFALMQIKPNFAKLVYFLPILCIIIGTVLVLLSKVLTLEGMQDLAVLVVGLLGLEIGFISLIVVYLLIYFRKSRRSRLI